MIKDNFSITQLFITKQIRITVDDDFFYMKAPTIKDIYTNDDFNACYHMWIMPIEKLQKYYIVSIQTSFQALQLLLFDLGKYDKYQKLAERNKQALKLIFSNLDINISQQQLKIGNITITEEIWEYILYILKSSCGEKINQPIIFKTEEARKQYMAQQKVEQKLAKIKQQRQVDSDSLAKNLLFITYAFPSLTFDYLCEQTMAQIHWLQKYAAGAMSYEINAQAMAAGNMKKNKKLDFFIK